jgi:hypothetical protein
MVNFKRNAEGVAIPDCSHSLYRDFMPVLYTSFGHLETSEVGETKGRSETSKLLYDLLQLGLQFREAFFIDSACNGMGTAPKPRKYKNAHKVMKEVNFFFALQLLLGHITGIIACAVLFATCADKTCPSKYER